MDVQTSVSFLCVVCGRLPCQSGAGEHAVEQMFFVRVEVGIICFEKCAVFVAGDQVARAVARQEHIDGRGKGGTVNELKVHRLEEVMHTFADLTFFYQHGTACAAKVYVAGVGLYS